MALQSWCTVAWESCENREQKEENCVQNYILYACVYKTVMTQRKQIQGRKDKSNETPTWCNTVQVLFLQSHSTCFGPKRPSSGVFKISTAATGTCVIVSGKSSHLLIRAGVPALIRRCDDLPATITHVPVAAVLVLNTPDDGRLRPKHVQWLCRNKTCTVLHQVGVSFDLSSFCSCCYRSVRLKLPSRFSAFS